MGITEQLDQLAELQSKRDMLELNKRAMIDSVITPEILTKIAEIGLEFAPSFVEVSEKISVLEEEIKISVLAEGKSIKGGRLMAVWSKGRVSWNTAALDGFAVVHPELMKFKKEGDPSVSIRVNK